MLHFAYGSNMSRAVMRREAPAAQPLAIGELFRYRFIITADGYASIAPAPGQIVYGVLWRLTPRDCVKLDAWEDVARGRYRAEMLPVRCAGRRRLAVVYVAWQRNEGRPRAGYMEIIIDAARAWQLPLGYIVSLQTWLPPGGRGRAGIKKFGDLG